MTDHPIDMAARIDELVHARDEARAERDEAIRERDEERATIDDLTCERDSARDERDQARSACGVLNSELKATAEQLAIVQRERGELMEQLQGVSELNQSLRAVIASEPDEVDWTALSEQINASEGWAIVAPCDSVLARGLNALRALIGDRHVMSVYLTASVRAADEDHWTEVSVREGR